MTNNPRIDDQVRLKVEDQRQLVNPLRPGGTKKVTHT